MTEKTFVTYSYAQVGAGALFPASNPTTVSSSLDGRSFTLSEAQIADTTDLTINDVDGDGMFDDQDPAGASGQTYDAAEQMVSFDGDTSATYAGADWNTYAKYTVTGSDGSVLSVSLVARADPSEPRLAVKPDGTLGSESDYYYYAFNQPLKAGVTYTYSNWDQRGQVAWDSLVVPCFTAGTLIETVDGPVAVEHLQPGVLVKTAAHGLQPIRWIGSRQLTQAALLHAPNLRPVRICAGALGQNLPTTDLLVSPQHRVLVRSAIAQKMFGTAEVLVAAKQLCQITGIDIADDVTGVAYYHILFDRHEIVISNGAETESLFTGPEALKSVGKAARQEILTLFPELARPDFEVQPAAILASGRMGRKLAVRHGQNHRPLLN